MRRMAEEPTPVVSPVALEALAERLSGKADVLQRLQGEAGEAAEEVSDVG